MPTSSWRVPAQRGERIVDLHDGAGRVGDRDEREPVQHTEQLVVVCWDRGTPRARGRRAEWSRRRWFGAVLRHPVRKACIAQGAADAAAPAGGVDVVEEADHCVVERVVAITRDHVPGATDIGVSGGRGGRGRGSGGRPPRSGGRSGVHARAAPVRPPSGPHDRAARRRPSSTRASLSNGREVTNAGSQRQYQRPSSRWRTFLRSPERSDGRGRCGL